MADATILPANGQKPATNLVMELGDSGLRAFGGYINEEFLRQLSGSQGKRIFREMSENDATVGAILEVFSAMICSVEWSVTAADETPEAEKAKKFFEEVLEDMDTPLPDVIAEICTMFPYGFAPMEKVQKPRRGETPFGEAGTTSKFDDGLIGYSKIALRGQSSIQRWEIDDSGKILGLHQNTQRRGSVFIPAERLALFRTTNIKNNPEGRSVLRRAYRAWYMKTKMEEVEAIGVERDLAGLPVLRIPNKYLDPNASPEEKAFANACEMLVSQLRRESREGVVIASDTYVDDQGRLTNAPLVDLKLLNSGGGRTFDTNAIIGRYDRAMAMSVLMDFMFLGQGSTGSWALSSDKTALAAVAVGAYLKRIAATLNEQVLVPLMKLNGFKQTAFPKLTPGDLEKQDINEVATLLSTMAGAGLQVFADRESENWGRKLIGMPLAPEEGLGDQGAPGDAIERPALMDDPSAADAEWTLPN